MARYGDLDKVLELVNEVNEDGNFTSYAHYSFLFDSIDNLPTIEQPERKKGKWITVLGRFGNEVECNQCHSVFWYWMGNYRFCPSCGARMEGESDD